MINVPCAANQYDRMISEGSCDTEDERNDAENQFRITRINDILKCIETGIVYCNNISQYDYFTVYLITYMHCSLWEH